MKSGKTTGAPGLPFPDYEIFERKHFKQRRNTESYVTSGRGRMRASKTFIDGFKRSGAFNYNAANTFAHLAVAKPLAEELSKLPRASSQFVGLFITFVPSNFAHGVSDHGVVDLEKLRAEMAIRLAGFNFVAAIEPAHYVNMGLSGPDGKSQPALSWHVHAIVWHDPMATEIQSNFEFGKSLIERRCATDEAFLPGAKAVDVRRLTRGNMGPRALYMLKLPMRSCRAFSVQHEHIDNETGEITKRPIGRFDQHKDDIRPGDLQKTLESLAGYDLRKLVFAGGTEGEVILAQAWAEADATINRRLAKYRPRPFPTEAPDCSMDQH